jgi:hypothetical protein
MLVDGFNNLSIGGGAAPVNGSAQAHFMSTQQQQYMVGRNGTNAGPQSNNLAVRK